MAPGAVVAVGVPVFAGSVEGLPRPQSAPPLRVIAEILREHLDLSGSVPQVVDAATEVLGLTFPEGTNLMTRARQCHIALNGDGSWQRRPSRPGSARAQAAQAASQAITERAVPAIAATAAPADASIAEGTPLEETAPPPVLRCRGVEFGFQYYNFYGEWHLSSDMPLCNERPHYQHNTMYGGVAHLFHVLDSHYNVPRWVIGPAPGNENGWAFCESDAHAPHEIGGEWISWDGVSWHSTATLRFVIDGEEGEDDDPDYDEEAALESLYVGDDGEAAERQRQASQAASAGGDASAAGGATTDGASDAGGGAVQQQQQAGGGLPAAGAIGEAAATPAPRQQQAGGAAAARSSTHPPPPPGSTQPKPQSSFCLVM